MGTFLIFLLLAGIFAGIAWWHVRENQRLIKQWQASLDAATCERLTRFAWTRTAQVLAACALCTMVIVIYHQRLSNANQALVELSKLAAIIAQPKPIANPQAQQPAKPVDIPTPDSYYPPLVATPQPVQKQRPTINDVYNPDQNGGGSEAVLDDIKKRYEGIIVTFMFLSKCGKANANDYAVINSALMREMTIAHAPGKLQSDIITAAQGSYQEMYSRSTCDGPEITTLVAQYANYIAALAKNSAAR